MRRQELIECFADTQWQSLHAWAEQTQAARANTRLYPPGFRAAARAPKSSGRAIQVIQDTTLHCAQQHGRGRVAVLNFANAYHPGGGVTSGSTAQEECLCRSSNLYCALTAPDILERYYRYNKDHIDAIGTDTVVYTPGVWVFKTDDAPHETLERPFKVDVLTCAAPDLRYAPGGKREAAARAFYGRIANILEVANENDADTLILGAFGCGAFGNDPEQVAEAFRALLIDRGYRDRFAYVIFAIKANDAVNSNLRAFQRAFARDGL